MSPKKAPKYPKGRPVEKGVGKVFAPTRLKLAAIGMEAEFSLFIDNKLVKPEDLFRDPRAFIRSKLMHRIGTSYHLPTGGAVYFDTGVIEVATPVIEIAPGCAARAGRSLWESILFIREELDNWEKQSGRSARLVGFSTHYNISFELLPHEQGVNRTLAKLAYLLSYLLPVPVMILATNKRSTGVGVRPRGDRVEVTVDFTPSASLMIATGAFITGVVRSVMQWPRFDLKMLDRSGIPVIQGYKPVKHTSRKGWLARFDTYPENPFSSDIDEHRWQVRDAYFKKRGLEETKLLSLRDIAQAIFSHFEPAIKRIANPFTYPLIDSILSGHAPSLLDLEDRPLEYEDVGRLCYWDNLFPEDILARSQYERVLIRAISGKKLRMNGVRYTPTSIHGWSEVIFRRDSDGSHHAFSIDELVHHLKDWE